MIRRISWIAGAGSWLLPLVLLGFASGQAHAGITDSSSADDVMPVHYGHAVGARLTQSAHWLSSQMWDVGKPLHSISARGSVPTMTGVRIF